MTKEEKHKLLDILILLDGMGDANSMVRLRFDKARKKDWKKFMEEYYEIVRKIK
tara:strand:+ start:127 stop:288 length:162 start_codon:yes stop_codon:yes gene_type:complete